MANDGASLTDEIALVKRAQEGDNGAFQEIFARSRDQVFRLSFDLCGSRQAAEDLLQDVYLKAFRNLSGFRGESKLSTWLHRITINRWMDIRKATGEHCDPLDEDRVADGLPGAPVLQAPLTPDQLTDASMIRDHIETALATLTANERAIFVLRHYHDMRLKDIAATMNLAEGTVKSHLFRALKRLQKHLLPYRREMGMEGLA